MSARAPKSAAGGIGRHPWLALGAVVAAIIAAWGPGTAPAATRLDPPLSSAVELQQAGASADLVVTWPRSWDGAAVHLVDVGTGADAGDEACTARCGDLVFRTTAFGQAYRADVERLAGARVVGSLVATAPVTPVDGCGVSACVTVGSALGWDPGGDQAASGLLDTRLDVGRGSGNGVSLHARYWRGAPVELAPGQYDWGSWDRAAASGAHMMLILSNLWAGTHPWAPQTPWSNWAAYRGWVVATVRAIRNSHHRVDYWEIYNEPGQPGYYPSWLQSTVTPERLLEQFLVAYRAIRSVDPHAAIVGPSLEAWSDLPGFGPLDMVRFVDFAAAHHLRLAALSWHEVASVATGNPSDATLSPLDIEDEAAQARQLLAAHPDLGHPRLFVDEYGQPAVQSMPGWDVDYLAALAAAGVAEAGRSCWFGECYTADLDGLVLEPDHRPLPVYWERVAYARMRGRELSVTSSDDTVDGLATQSPSGSIDLLVGRGAGCTSSASCPLSQGLALVPAPETVEVTVPVPLAWQSARVSIREFPATAGSLLDLPQRIELVDTEPGQVTVTLPAFSDGAAYQIVVGRSGS